MKDNAPPIEAIEYAAGVCTLNPRSTLDKRIMKNTKFFFIPEVQISQLQANTLLQVPKQWNHEANEQGQIAKFDKYDFVDEMDHQTQPESHDKRLLIKRDWYLHEKSKLLFYPTEVNFGNIIRGRDAVNNEWNRIISNMAPLTKQQGKDFESLCRDADSLRFTAYLDRLSDWNKRGEYTNDVCYHLVQRAAHPMWYF